jgi:hypothetical protein
MNTRPLNLPGSRDDARRKAQSHFEIADARTELVKKIMDEERKALEAKTAKLRALRLAKEEEDRLIAASNPTPAPAQKTRAKIKRIG